MRQWTAGKAAAAGAGAISGAHRRTHQRKREQMDQYTRDTSSPHWDQTATAAVT